MTVASDQKLHRADSPANDPLVARRRWSLLRLVPLIAEIAAHPRQNVRGDSEASARDILCGEAP